MVRWGVVGPGGIATKFASGMELVGDGEIVAVCSRSASRANAFADRWHVPGRYDDYEAMLGDGAVDAIYVATPHARHEADTIAALEAGKPVLCEKPIALNATQTRRMVDAARSRNLFLMDAIWSRFLPAYRVLVDVVGSGRIGDPVVVEADFGFRVPPTATHRLFDPALGGGGLLDLGIYPVQLCSLILGAPEAVSAEAVIGSTGVDEVVAAILRHSGGGIGVVKASLRTNFACTARISGTRGAIEIPAFHHCPMSITVIDPEGRDEVDCSFSGEGLRFEIEEVHRCLADGATESETMPLDETIRLMETLDEIRRQIGLVYPDEEGQ